MKVIKGLVFFISILLFSGTIFAVADIENLIIGGKTDSYSLIDHNSLGQTFSVPLSMERFNTIGIRAASWGDDNGGFTLTVWDSPKKNTKIASKKIDTAWDDSWIYISFPEQKVGAYYWEISDATSYNKSQIGVWGDTKSDYKNGQSYIDGNVADANLDFLTCARYLSFQITPKTKIFIEESFVEVENTALKELKTYLSKMLGEPVSDVNLKDLEFKDSIVIGTPNSSGIINALKEELELSGIKNDGYIVRPVRYKNSDILVIAANEPRGVLYGVYGLLKDLGVNIYSENEPLPASKSFNFASVIRTESFFNHRSGGITDGILKFWEPMPSGSLENMWEWYAKNGLNMLMYHSMAGNYPDHPELSAFLGTGLGCYIYFEDYPKLEWKKRNGKIIENGRENLNYMISSAKKWGVDIVLSVYEPGYPDGLLEAYPEIKGNHHYPCPANPAFWTYMESQYRELFLTFPDLKGIIFSTGENARGNIVNSRCDICCGVNFEDKDNWKIKQWERPGLVCMHINIAIKSVKPDALVIFRPHLFDMTLGNTAQRTTAWDPCTSNALMQQLIPDDVVMLRRPHDHDFVSNAGNNQFLGAGLGPQPEGMLLSGGGEYRGKMTIPCAEIEEFRNGKERIPFFADKKVDNLIIAMSFYQPTITGPSGVLGIDNMNNDHFAQLALEPFKDANDIWAEWAGRYFKGAEMDLIEIMKPSYRMMYRLGYETEFDIRGTRYSFPKAFQGPRNIKIDSVDAAKEAYQISSQMYGKFETLSHKINKNDFTAGQKYLLENRKLHKFWLNYIEANYYYYNWDEMKFTNAIKTLNVLTPNLDFPVCPWIDVWRDCITAPISYQENCAAFISNVSGKLPDKPDYSYPIIDLYRYEGFNFDQGKIQDKPYITAILIDRGSGINFDCLKVKLDGKVVNSSEYSITKNMLLVNPSFERGLREYPDEWIPQDEGNKLAYSYLKSGDGTEHSGTDCIKLEVLNSKAAWKTKEPVAVTANSEYLFSCWTKTGSGNIGTVSVGAIEFDSNDVVLLEHKAKAEKNDYVWANTKISFNTGQFTKKVSLILEIEGSGTVFFDDVVFASKTDAIITARQLLVFSPENLSKGYHQVVIDVKDKAGNVAPSAKISFEIVNDKPLCNENKKH